jgi:hypothetical protein
MDPLAEALQLLQDAHDTIAILLETLANKGKEQDNSKKQPDSQMQKQASEQDLAVVFGVPAKDLPEFAKYASMEDAQILRESIERELSYGSLGKVAQVGETSEGDTPGARLNATLANILER